MCTSEVVLLIIHCLVGADAGIVGIGVAIALRWTAGVDNTCSVRGNRAASFLHFLFVFLPHIAHRCQIVIGFLVVLEIIQCFSKDLLNAHVSSISQELFGCGNEFGVEVLRESLSGVVTKDPDQHNGIVLHVGALEVILRKEFADAIGSFPRSSWA